MRTQKGGAKNLNSCWRIFRYVLRKFARYAGRIARCVFARFSKGCVDYAEIDGDSADLNVFGLYRDVFCVCEE